MHVESEVGAGAVRSVGQEQVDASRAGHCCSPAAQTSCCAPEAKRDCCASFGEGVCGCR
jgi:hypothetical protein